MNRARYYAAYGSNLNITQMKRRCPGAKTIYKSNMTNYRLMFKGSKTGSYLTVEKCKGSSLPVVLWKITKKDEEALDRYEGYPFFYDKIESMKACQFSTTLINSLKWIKKVQRI